MFMSGGHEKKAGNWEMQALEGKAQAYTVGKEAYPNFMGL